VTDLITAGLARAWAIVNWPADRLFEASRAAARLGRPQPCAAQLPYSLVRRSPVQDGDMRAALAACGAPVVASFVLAGGVLTGKYREDAAAGRAAGTLGDPAVASAAAAGQQVVDLAARLGTAPATLATAYTLLDPSVATVLFGATTPRQVQENVAALELADRLDDGQRAELLRIGAPA
jgi:L-glyceraldehyde 3-phosphate reductase